MLLNLIYNLKHAFILTFLKPIRHGRASRAEFWYANMASVICTFIGYIILKIADNQGFIVYYITLGMTMVMSIYAYFCGIMLLRRRVHDYGRSFLFIIIIYIAIWFLNFLISTVITTVSLTLLSGSFLTFLISNAIYYGLFGIKKGDKHYNKYGLSPYNNVNFRPLISKSGT
ncbi:MAG: hypothetical protein BGO27_08430 [Alphaproteobacteria bacterium 33-17]|nr:MAG: hypothetical protein BGO27_08430 [Alphaproteobacteria bacterium 33-17]